MGLNTKTVSADAISTSQNNYAPLVSTVATAGTFFRINPTTALDITGLDVASIVGSGTSDGAVITLLNVGSGAITFKHQNASSSTANRLITGNATDLVVGAGQSVSFQYDPVASRWTTTSATTALTGGGGSVGPGSTGAIAKFTAASTIGDSVIAESGGFIGVNTTSPAARLHVHTGALRLTDATGLGLSEPNEISGSAANMTYTARGSHDFITNSDNFGPSGDYFSVWNIDTAGTAVFRASADGLVGVGTNTPTARFTVVGGVLSGTATTGIEFAFDANGGNIQTYNSKPLLLNPSGNNVGIGTTAPKALLEIGASGITNTSSTIPSSTVLIASKAVDGESVVATFFNSQPQAASSTNETTRLDLTWADGGGNTAAASAIVAGKLGDYSTAGNAHSYLAFYTASSNTVAEKMRIDKDGKLSITGSTLQIGTSTTSGYVLTADASGNGTWQAATGGSSQWTTAGSDIYYTTGKVGIGTASPGQVLSVVGNTILDDTGGGARMSVTIFKNATGNTFPITNGAQYTEGPILQVTSNSGTTGAHTGIIFIPDNSGWGSMIQGRIATTSATAMDFYARNGSAFTLGMTLDYTGYLGIGTSSPGSALDVKGTLRLSGATSGYVGLAPAAAAGSTTYTLPSADGTNGYVLSTNGAGTLSWASPGAATLTVGSSAIGSGTAGRVLFEGTGNVLQESANLFWDQANSRLGVGTASPSRRLEVDGDIRMIATGNAALTIKIPANTNFGQFIFYDETDTNRGYVGYIGSNAGLGARNDTVEFGSNGKAITFRPSETELMRLTSTFVSITASNGNGLSISNAVDTTLQIVPVGSGQIRFRTDSAGRWLSFADGDGTTDTMVVRSGSVGIGTNNPGVLLDVVKNQAAATQVKITNSNASGYTDFVQVNDGGYWGVVGLYGSGTSYKMMPTGDLHLYSNSPAGISVFADHVSADVRFGAGGTSTTQMILKTDGKVGIGTTAPATLLHLSSASPSLRIQDSDNGGGTASTAIVEFGQTESSAWSRTGYVGDGFGGQRTMGIVAESTIPIKMFTDGGTTPTVTVSGTSVGISTESPGAKLDVVGSSTRLRNSGTGAATYTIINDSSDAANSSYLLYGIDVSGAVTGYGTTSAAFVSTGKNGTGAARDLILHNFGAKDIIFATNNTECARILSGGNVGIGTASPSTILALGGNSARTFQMERHTTSNTAGNNLTVLAGGATSGATDKNGGNLILSSGVATGTGTSKIILQTYDAGSTGTSDASATTKIEVSSTLSVKTHAAFAGSEHNTTTAAVQTTDATQTTLKTLTLEDSSVYWIEATVIGRKAPASAERCRFTIKALVYRESAGSATIEGTVDQFAQASAGASTWDVTVTVSGNDARISVTGATTTTINWAGTINYQRVSGNA